jgi:hypothetical protein
MKLTDLGNSNLGTVAGARLSVAHTIWDCSGPTHLPPLSPVRAGTRPSGALAPPPARTHRPRALPVDCRCWAPSQPPSPLHHVDAPCCPPHLVLCSPPVPFKRASLAPPPSLPPSQARCERHSAPPLPVIHDRLLEHRRHLPPFCERHPRSPSG